MCCASIFELSECYVVAAAPGFQQASWLEVHVPSFQFLFKKNSKKKASVTKSDQNPNSKLCAGGRVGNCWFAAAPEKLPNFGRLRVCLSFVTKLMNIQAKSIPDALMLPSFCAQQVRTGDLVLMPAGFLVLEKAIHDNDIGIRWDVFDCFLR